jgi:hypothetical protein
MEQPLIREVLASYGLIGLGQFLVFAVFYLLLVALLLTLFQHLWLSAEPIELPRASRLPERVDSITRVLAYLARHLNQFSADQLIDLLGF